MAQHATIPVLMMSGRDDEYTREAVLELGAQDLLSKPFEVAYLLRRVRRLLEK